MNGIVNKIDTIAAEIAEYAKATGQEVEAVAEEFLQGIRDKKAALDVAAAAKAAAAQPGDADNTGNGQSGAPASVDAPQKSEVDNSAAGTAAPQTADEAPAGGAPAAEGNGQADAPK